MQGQPARVGFSINSRVQVVFLTNHNTRCYTSPKSRRFVTRNYIHLACTSYPSCQIVLPCRRLIDCEAAYDDGNISVLVEYTLHCVLSSFILPYRYPTNGHCPSWPPESIHCPLFLMHPSLSLTQLFRLRCILNLENLFVFL